jgi:hypothetical protein
MLRMLQFLLHLLHNLQYSRRIDSGRQGETAEWSILVGRKFGADR